MLDILASHGFASNFCNSENPIMPSRSASLNDSPKLSSPTTVMVRDMSRMYPSCTDLKCNVTYPATATANTAKPMHENTLNPLFSDSRTIRQPNIGVSSGFTREVYRNIRFIISMAASFFESVMMGSLIIISFVSPRSLHRKYDNSIHV